jgi:starch-binding outer membrane protein SusE/F
MKSWINKCFILFFASLTLMSCEKDEEMVFVNEQGTAPALKATSSNMVLTKENASQDATTISWSASDFGFNAAVKYTLQVDKKGSNFANAKTIELGPALNKKYTVAELNKLAIQLGLKPNTAGDIEFRVKSEISPSVPSVFSNVISASVTPYLDIIEYPSLWVPGSHQGWTPATAPKIASVNDNGVYEGYLYFPDAKTNFKLNPAPNWDNDFGGTSSGNKGTLAPKASDLEVNGAGYYLLKANTNSLTWSALKTTWGVIGDATAGSWGADQAMTYDVAAKVWKATIPLTVGEIKFRANGNWDDINYGDNGADGTLEAGGDNIKVTQAGSYQITLDLSIPGNYNYTLKKL